MAKYYPAGNFGPVCDPLVDSLGPAVARDTSPEPDDGRQTYPYREGPIPEGDPYPDGFIGGPPIININASPERLPPVDPNRIPDSPELVDDERRNNPSGLLIRDVKLVGPGNIVPNVLQNFNVDVPNSDIPVEDLNYDWDITDLAGNRIVDPFPISDDGVNGDLTVNLKASRASAPVGTKVLLNWNSSPNATTVVGSSGPGFAPQTVDGNQYIITVPGPNTFQITVSDAGPGAGDGAGDGGDGAGDGAGEDAKTATATVTIIGVGKPDDGSAEEDSDECDPRFVDGVLVSTPCNQNTSMDFPNCGPYRISVTVSHPDADDSPRNSSGAWNCIDSELDDDNSPDLPDLDDFDVEPYKSVLCYSSDNADDVVRSDFGAESPTGDCFFVEPQEDTVYCITMSNQFGSSTACAGIAPGDTEPPPDDDTSWPDFPDPFDPGIPFIDTQICKDEYEPGEKDCEFTYLNPDPDTPDWEICLDPKGDCYPYPKKFLPEDGFDFDVDVPTQERNSCFNFNPDVNIKTLVFYKKDGSEKRGAPIKLSEPLTYPVTSFLGTETTENDLCIGISRDGNKLIATGKGSGACGVTFSWDDNPKTASTALLGSGTDKYEFTQKGEEGDKKYRLNNLKKQTYQIDYDLPLGKNVEKRISATQIKFDDNPANGFDTNAKLSILNGESSGAAEFDGDLNLKVTSPGDIVVEFEWDDNPSTSGIAVNKITISVPNGSEQADMSFSIPGVQRVTSNGDVVNGVTFKQRGEVGEQSESITIPGPGEYPIVWNDLNPINIPFKKAQLKEPIDCEGGGSSTVTFNRGTEEEHNDQGFIVVSPGTYTTTIIGNDGGFDRGLNQTQLRFNDGYKGIDAYLTATNLSGGTATFAANGNLVVGGSGTQQVMFRFEVNENPDKNGKAVQKIIIGDQPSGTRLRMTAKGFEDLLVLDDSVKVRAKEGLQYWPRRYDKKGEEMRDKEQTFTVIRHGVTVTFSVWPVYTVKNDNNTAGDIDSVWWINSWAGELPASGKTWTYTFTPENRYTDDAQQDITVEFESYGGRDSSSGGSVYRVLELRDEKNDDANGTIRLTPGIVQSTITSRSLWTEEGNKYAVWVNPEVCTLPDEVQEVSYEIVIPSKGDYEFVWGADHRCLSVVFDGNEIFKNKKQGMVVSGVAEPYRVTLDNLRAGTYDMVVKVKNNSGGFIRANGGYKNKAYDWGSNPGGWYMKICFGGKCNDFAESPSWVRVGPHQRWQQYPFLNDFAVYPEQKMLTGTVHQEEWIFIVPESTNYQLEYAADNIGTLTLQRYQNGAYVNKKVYTDGTLVSKTKNLSLKEGLYKIIGTVENLPISSNRHNVWANNPGGYAFNLTRVSELSNIEVRLLQDGSLEVTGSGRAQVTMELEYDDNPDYAGTGLGTYQIAGMNFTRDLSIEKGKYRTSAIVTPQIYKPRVKGNDGGYGIRGNSKICFYDKKGEDCNIFVEIKGTPLPLPDPNNSIISSLDLTATQFDNVIWNTRYATGYGQSSAIIYR